MEQLTPMTVLQTTIAKTTTWNNMEQHLSQPTVATTSLTIQHPTLFIKTLQNNCMISHDYYSPSVNIHPYQSSPRWHPTYGGDSGDDLSKLELIEDRGLSRSIESHHQDPHFLLPEEALKTRRMFT